MPNDTIIEALNKQSGGRLTVSKHDDTIRLSINKNAMRRNVIVSIFKKLNLQYHSSKDNDVDRLEIHQSSLPSLIHDPEFKHWLAAASEEEEFKLQFKTEAIVHELKANSLVMTQDVMLFDKYGLFDANQSQGVNEIDILFAQIVNYAGITKKQHEANGFDQNKNHVTRFISSEFSFFTKAPLSINEFEILLDKIYGLAETYPSNIHLFLCTFSVMSPTQTVMNVAVVVECGANPKVHLKSKVHSSNIDPVYKIGTRPLPNESGLGVHVKIKDITYIIASHPMIFETKGGAKYIQVLDICLDHKYGMAMNLYNVFRMGMPAPYQASHIISSNHIRRHPQYCIGTVSHVDPVAAESLYGTSLSTDKNIRVVASEPAIVELVNTEVLNAIQDHNDFVYQNTEDKMTYERIIDIASNQLSELEGNDLVSARLITLRALRLLKSEYVDQFHEKISDETRLHDKSFRAPILRLIRNYGMNQNATEIQTHSALMRQVQKSIESQSLRLMPDMMQKGVNLNQKLANGMTPLVYAMHHIRDTDVMNAFIEYFITMGADPNHRLEGKEYPILIAYNLMLSPIVLLKLIEGGADCEASYRDGRTMLDKALQNENAPVLKILCEHSYVMQQEQAACQKIISKHMKELERSYSHIRKESVRFSEVKKEQQIIQYDADHENDNNIKQSKREVKQIKVKTQKKKKT